MAHLSDFTRRRQADTEDFLSKLVSTVLDAQPGDDHHEAGLEWCLASIGWHQHTDVNSSSVAAQYENLGKRLIANAQFSKQAMLARLVTALHRQELQHDTLEARHSILSTIMHLAGKPLKINYQPSTAALACLQGISQEGEADDTCSEASALSHWNELDGQASSSSLSDWGDHKTETGSAEDSSPQMPQTPQDPAAEKRNKTAKMIQLGQLDTKTKAAKLPINSSGVPRLVDGCLLRKVLEQRATGKSLTPPPLELCFTEDELVHQILHMLRGCPSPGKAFRLNTTLDAFDIAPGVHVPHLSSACLCHLMLHWVELGTTALRLRISLDAMRKAATASGRDNAKSPIAASTTLAAYATAFASELAYLEQTVIQLQDHFKARSCMGTAEASDVNLATLEAALQGVVRHIGMLECVAGGISIADQNLKSAAQQGVSVMDGLHRLLLSASENSTPQGREYAAVLMRLLLATLKPTVDKLQLWAEEGSLEDIFNELPIHQGQEGVTAQSPSFWRDAFSLRKDDKGCLLCPELFKAAADDILEAGKASLLLHAESRVGMGVPSAALDVISLHTEMVRRLTRQVSISILNMPAPLQGAIADRMAAAAAAGSSLQQLSELFLSDPSAALHSSRWTDSSSAAVRLSTPETSDLLPADRHVAHSLEAASLQQPASTLWRLDRHLSKGSTEVTSEAAPRLTREPESRSLRLEGVQSHSQDHSCSPQQENEPTEIHHEHARHNSSALPRSTGILGDVSNLFQLTEHRGQAAKHEGLATMQAATNVGADSEYHKQETPSAPSPESSAESTRGQVHPMQADHLLRDWYERIMEGICDTYLLQDGSQESGTEYQPSSKAVQRLHSVLITAHTGSAVQQMWGAQWTASAEDTAGSLQILKDADLSPVQALLESCILAPLQERAQRSRQALMQQVTGSWALQQHLEALWRTFFLATPALQPFLCSLCAILATSDRNGAQLRAVEVQRALDVALSDAEEGILLPSSSITVRQDEPAKGSAGMASLGGLRLDVSIPWPLTLVVQDVHLQQYNTIFTVLSQVHVATKALNEVRSSACAARRDQGLNRAGCLAMSMRHFLGTYLAHVMGHLVHYCASALQTAVADASSLEGVISAHEQFLAHASGIAFTAPQQTTKLLKTALKRLLALVWEFSANASSAWRQTGAADADAYSDELGSLWEAWQERYGYFKRLLNSCALRAPPMSGLKELAASI